MFVEPILWMTGDRKIASLMVAITVLIDLILFLLLPFTLTRIVLEGEGYDELKYVHNGAHGYHT
jgi:hypothetical protein